MVRVSINRPVPLMSYSLISSPCCPKTKSFCPLGVRASSVREVSSLAIDLVPTYRAPLNSNGDVSLYLLISSPDVPPTNICKPSELKVSPSGSGSCVPTTNETSSCTSESSKGAERLYWFTISVLAEGTLSKMNIFNPSRLNSMLLGSAKLK